jgi:hypothetical protein
MLQYHQLCPHVVPVSRRPSCCRPPRLHFNGSASSWLAARTFPAFDDAQKDERRTKPLTGAQRGSRAGDRERRHRPLMLTKKGERRTKPQWPPVRPLHRLAIGAQHTVKYWETHPTAWLWWPGRRQDRACGKAEIGFRRGCLFRSYRPSSVPQAGGRAGGTSGPPPSPPQSGAPKRHHKRRRHWQ